MAHQVITKVPFILSNVSKCLCPGCPVQLKSKCVAGLKKDLSSALTKSPLNAKVIPGVYYSAGKADYKDIDTKQNYICDGCAVFMECHLADGKPVGYCCRKGAAG